MRSYLWVAVVLSGALLGSYYLTLEVNIGPDLHPLFPLLIYFFLGQSLPIGWMMGIALRNPAQSAMIFLASIGFRMITGLGLLLVFYFFSVPDITDLSIQFMVVYLIYLLFELSVVLTNLRRNSS